MSVGAWQSHSTCERRAALSRCCASQRMQWLASDFGQAEEFESARPDAQQQRQGEGRFQSAINSGVDRALSVRTPAYTFACQQP